MNENNCFMNKTDCSKVFLYKNVLFGFNQSDFFQITLNIFSIKTENVIQEISFDQKNVIIIKCNFLDTMNFFSQFKENFFQLNNLLPRIS